MIVTAYLVVCTQPNLAWVPPMPEWDPPTGEALNDGLACREIRVELPADAKLRWSYRQERTLYYHGGYGWGYSLWTALQAGWVRIVEEGDGESE